MTLKVVCLVAIAVGLTIVAFFTQLFFDPFFQPTTVEGWFIAGLLYSLLAGPAVVGAALSAGALLALRTRRGSLAHTLTAVGATGVGVSTGEVLLLFGLGILVV